MSTFGDSGAAELAGMLDGMERFPHNTGALSMLDEATLVFGWKYEQVGPPQRAFAQARHAHMNSYRSETRNYSDEAWRNAMDAAHALAAVLRPLGDTRIARCKRQAKWGTCDLALDDDGTCHGGEHVDETGSPS